MSTLAYLDTSPKMGQIKYRAACDHCSSTKTKCTQERPSCQRCLALGRVCNYSKSLRAGKPPRSSKKLKQTATSPVLPRPSPQIDSEFLVDSPGQIWSNTTPYPTPTLNPSDGPTYVTPGDLISHPGSVTSQPLSPPQSDWLLDYNHGCDLLSDYKSPSPHAGCLEAHNGLQFPSLYSEVGGEFEELARFHANPTKCTSETDDCVRLATSALASLYTLPMTTASGQCSNDRRPTLNEALEATSLAMQNLHTIMAYICAKDFTLPMVVLSIVSKLLAWYQAVVCVHDSCTNGLGMAQELIVDGALSTNGSWVLKHQFVQGQLHSLSGILATFRTCYCSDKLTEASMMFASMEGHLRTRLIGTMQEIDARLRACLE